MGDFLYEAIIDCDSIDMLKRGLEHIKDKIRQQLQIIRDRGVIEFVSRGIYKKKN